MKLKVGGSGSTGTTHWGSYPSRLQLRLQPEIEHLEHPFAVTPMSKNIGASNVIRPCGAMCFHYFRSQNFLGRTSGQDLECLTPLIEPYNPFDLAAAPGFPGRSKQLLEDGRDRSVQRPPAGTPVDRGSQDVSARWPKLFLGPKKG